MLEGGAIDVAQDLEDRAVLPNSVTDGGMGASGIASIYPDLAAYERAIDKAAEDLARGRRFRWEREVLAAACVVLATLLVLKIIALVLEVPRGRFISGSLLLWASAVGLAWSAWYLWRVKRLKDCIVEQRLCFCCGASLRDTITEEGGRGFCLECGTVFTLSEYLAPANCVAALRSARERMLATCPRAPDRPKPAPKPILPVPFDALYLYEDGAHYDRVMNRAASRILALQAANIRVSLLASISCLTIAGVVGTWVLGIWFAALIPAVMFGLVLACAWEMHRITKMRGAIRADRLCIGCGYPLAQLAPNMMGGGVCPECGRPYHVREYVRPPGDCNEPEWRRLRAIAMPDPKV